MKIAVIYFLALVISFEVFAYESANKSSGDYQLESRFGMPVIVSQNTHTVSWPQAKTADHAIDQPASEKQDALLTEVSIYALIILVYSIYWKINNKPTV